MKSKTKIDFKNKKTIIITSIIAIIVVGFIIFLCTKLFSKKPELTPDNPTTSEFENYLKDSIKGFDADSINDFIESTDNLATINEVYWGAMYSGDVHKNIKILYALSRLFYNDSTLIDYMTGASMFDLDTDLGDVKLSIKFINKVLDAKFKDTTIDKNTVITDGFFYGINAIICDDTYCIIPISRTTDSGNESDGLYASRKGDLTKVSGGYEMTVEDYYYELSFEGIMKMGIYSNAAKDVTFCETSLTEMYLGDFKNTDICKGEATYDKVKYKFDKNYKFVSAETV